MEPNFYPTTTDKIARYEQFLKEFALFIEGETEEISVLANTTAALREAFDWFWIGFYIVHGEELILGPFQGNTACFRIRKGRGVCGTAWAKACTQIVPDVEQFPGHIACNSRSRSEIVVPVWQDNKICAVLDVDSDQLNTFDEIDCQYLEQLCLLISQTLYCNKTKCKEIP